MKHCPVRQQRVKWASIAPSSIKDEAENRSIDTPLIAMKRSVFCHIMSTVGAYPAETGGILLGPDETDDVTEFFFDSSAECSAVTYSPDAHKLKSLMKERWIPNGLGLKGFVHSHPGSLSTLSGGDLIYIRRLLEINPDLPFFVAPIVLPSSFFIQPIVVLRSQPDRPRLTRLRLL